MTSGCCGAGGWRRTLSDYWNARDREVELNGLTICQESVFIIATTVGFPTRQAAALPLASLFGMSTVNIDGAADSQQSAQYVLTYVSVDLG